MNKPISANIKASLVIIAVFIIIGLLWYSQRIVETIQDRERQIVGLYAKTIEYVASAESSNDFSFLFTEIIQAIDFPIALSEPDNTPKTDSYRNIKIDSSLSADEQKNKLREIINEMDQINPPILIRYQNEVVEIVHYGESQIITQLRWLPLVEIIIGNIFILVGYIGFSHIKKNEQSNIWVGMAKETAHQLGTPLSSLSGWIEILRGNESINQAGLEQINEIENDLVRLNKVASRFSKIGSIPDLQLQNLDSIIERVIKYFEKRLPQMAKKIEITCMKEEERVYEAKLNSELFEWVLENLMKNASDAIESKAGKITVSVSEDSSFNIIDISDSGKGIEEKYIKDVFRPGYSTKQRGWGLGLSLSKRIIEDYHKGKIFIKETSPEKGTTFRIKLKK